MSNDVLYERVLEKIAIDSETGCWNWTASKYRGYGQIKLPQKRRQAATHRVTFEKHNGPIPKGAMVLHRCDNRACCNPAHLFLGDASANAKDMAAKNRHLYGERNTQHKMTTEQVRRVFDLSEQGYSQHQIAAMMNVGQMNICRILRGERWKHIYEERHGPRETV